MAEEPYSPSQEHLSYWRGMVDGRLKSIESSLENLGAHIKLMQGEIVKSNLRIARYIGMGAVLLAIITIFAPIIARTLFPSISVHP